MTRSSSSLPCVAAASRSSSSASIRPRRWGPRIALHAAERSHQQFFELSPLAQFIYASGTERVLAVNDAALSLYGYTRDEFLAVDLGDLRPPEPAAEASARIQAIGNADVVGRRRVRPRDGTLVSVEIWSNVATFEGKAARHVAVTERVDLGEVRASEARFRWLLKAAPDAVLLVDAGGTIVLVNGQAEVLFGYDQSSNTSCDERW